MTATIRWPLIAGVAWLALLGVGEIVGRLLPEMPTLCVFRGVTGVPCPTCGATRAVRAAAGGHGLEAIMLNPGLTLLAGLGVVWLGLRLAGRSWPRPRHRVTRWALTIAIVAAFLANWTYVIWREAAAAGA